MATKQLESPPIDPAQIEPLVGAAEVAPLLGCSRSMVYGLHRSQGLPGVKVGSRVKFLVSRVLTWREARETIVVVRREDVQGPASAVPQSTQRRGRMKRAEIEALNEEFPE